MRREMKTGLIQQMLPWIEKFLRSIVHLGKNTGQGYRKSLLSFVNYLDRSPARKCFPATVKKEVIAGWAKQLSARYSSSTVISSVRIVARFLSFLETKGVVHENQLGRLQKQHPRRGLTGVVQALLSPSPRKSLQTLRAPQRFTSPLGPQMRDFIALAKSQGKKYQNEEEILCRFDCFLNSYARPPRRLSDSIIKKWLILFPSSVRANRYLSFGVIRRFCLYLRRLDPGVYVPDSSLAPPWPPSSIPYIYSKQEIIALLEAAHHLRSSTLSPIRPQMFYMLILLLYTTGMRLSEALKLQLGDIDLKDQALVIRKTKFFKSRLVPIAPGVMKELENFLGLRQQAGLSTDDLSSLFQNPHRRGHYSKSGASGTFSKLLQQAGIKRSRGPGSPCIHSLRHTMAVHRLEDWYRRGEDVQSKLGLLATYLGHVNISSTQRYLTMTTELLQQASNRFRQYAKQENENE